MNFKHITIIHPSMHFLGGAERLMVDLALGLAKTGASVEFVAGVFHDRWRGELSQKGNFVKLKELGVISFGSVGFWLKIRRYAKALSKLVSSNCDLVICSGFPSSIAARYFLQHHGNVKIVNFLQEAPIVLHEREGLKLLPLRLRLFYRFVSFVYGGADIKAVKESCLLIANSDLTRGINSKIYGFSKSEIEVVYPGVHAELVEKSSILDMQIIAKYGLERKVIIFNPKGAQFWRNPLVFLRALAKLDRSDFVAVLSGGADYEVSSLKKIAAELGLTERVMFISDLSAEEMFAFYRSSSVLVSIPMRQSFGMMPLEALLCGTPAVVSESSGVTEVLRCNEDIFCIRHDDVDALERALETLIEDAVVRGRMVSIGRQRVLDEFTISRFVSEFKGKLENLAFC